MIIGKLTFTCMGAGRCVDTGDCTVPQQFLEVVQGAVDDCDADGCPPGGCDESGSADTVAIVAAVQFYHYHALMVAASGTLLLHSATWIGGDSLSLSLSLSLTHTHTHTHTHTDCECASLCVVDRWRLNRLNATYRSDGLGS